jgi:hypothetical protein
METPAPLRIRILLFQDLPGVWTARALEHDIVAEGRSMEAAMQAVLRIMRAHLDFDRRHHHEPLSGFPAAPQAYWNAFKRGTPIEWATLLSRTLPGVVSEISAAVAADRPLRTNRGVCLPESSRTTGRATLRA